MTGHNFGLDKTNVTGHNLDVKTNSRTDVPSRARGVTDTAAAAHVRERAAERLPAKSVSIRDVAAAAGVSYQTVLRVINGNPNVKDSTRQLVLDTIDQLRFRPNRVARALAGGPIQSVTVLTANTTLYGYATALQGIENAARAAGFAMGVQVMESGQPSVVQDAVDRAAEPGTALIVIAYDEPGIAVLSAVPPDVPVAAIIVAPAGDEAVGKPWVWLDDRRAAYEATRYLLGLGHQTVHHVSIPPSSPRTRGWRSALAEVGARIPEPVPGGWEPRDGYAAGRTLAKDPDVTAVLCGNDDLALGVMRAMHEASRPMPGSVSVVGFDDTPQSALYTPALTTVRQDFAALGRVCFATLLSTLDPRAATGPVPLPQCELIVRESSGPPPAAGTRFAT